METFCHKQKNLKIHGCVFVYSYMLDVELNTVSFCGSLDCIRNQQQYCTYFNSRNLSPKQEYSRIPIQRHDDVVSVPGKKIFTSCEKKSHELHLY